MEAFEDFNHALTFSNDPEVYYQRGVLYQQLRNFRRGVADFQRHNELTTSRSCQLWNYMGICQSQLGDIESALVSFRAAYELDDSFIDAHLNYAQMHKEVGRWEEAEELYDEILFKYAATPLMLQQQPPQVEKNISQLFYLRSILLYSLGRPYQALQYAHKYVALMFETPSSTVLKSAPPSSSTPLYQQKDLLQGYNQIALCYRSMGNYPEALRYYSLVLARDPEHVCRVQKRLMFHHLSLLDSPLHAFNLDRDVDPLWKEIWSKGLPANLLDIPDSPLESAGEASLLLPLYGEEGNAEKVMVPLSSSQQRVYELACQIGPWVQINSRGFLPNLRLQRGFGLAVLEMTQALLNNLESIHRTGSPLMVPNSGSSQKYLPREGHHPFGYRDLFDIVVRWRQLSEPNDPVWWIDGLLRESFEEGFGLQTPMLSGQLRCIRYYSYFKMGFELLRSQAAVQYYHASSLAVVPSKSAKKKIKKATTLRELHGLIGQDFYVVCPCESIANPALQSTVLEGTRLTVVKREPEGYEFSIRCPSMPIRWKAMSDEITECYERMILALYQHRYPADTLHLETPPPTPDPLHHSLQLFYYWTNFTPLTRGSAFCGYGALYAIVLAFGSQISSPIPEGKQLDWEAIFTPNPGVFIEHMRPLFTLTSFDHEEEFQLRAEGGGGNRVSVVNEAMPTLREALKLLHHNIEHE
jgi:tetratricopeptide (TPR) repeat protein